MPGPPSEDLATRTNRLHADEVDIDVPLVRRLVAERFPEMGDVMIRPVRSTGTVNTIYRPVIISMRDCPARRSGSPTWIQSGPGCPSSPRTLRWDPSPVAKGDPARGHPFSWAVYEWMDGRAVCG